MSKPTIFISSTCYDLSLVRSELQNYLELMGFEVLNSEKGSFGVNPQMHSHRASLDQVNNAHYLILIVGKRRGGTFIESESSITNEEYNLAIKRSIPVIAFVDKLIVDSTITYKKNPSADLSHIVDDKRIFHFVDYIKASSYNNWIFNFENIEDIKSTIKSQFAFYLKIFSESIQDKKRNQNKVILKEEEIASYPININNKLDKIKGQEEKTTFLNGLKSLYDTMGKILNSDTNRSAQLEKLKMLWLVARYGKFDGENLKINENIFKQYAWSTHKGQRILDQCKTFGINGFYEVDDETGIRDLIIIFNDETENSSPGWALSEYVKDLVEMHNENAINLFYQADMRLYMSE